MKLYWDSYFNRSCSIICLKIHFNFISVYVASLKKIFSSNFCKLIHFSVLHQSCRCNPSQYPLFYCNDSVMWGTKHQSPLFFCKFSHPLFLCLQVTCICFFIIRFVIESTKAKIHRSTKLLLLFCFHRTEGAQKNPDSCCKIHFYSSEKMMKQLPRGDKNVLVAPGVA
jgi:hypothetical protein